MNIGEITTMMGSLLEVSEDRYPSDIRNLHVNQAIRDLAMENNFPFDQRKLKINDADTLTGYEFNLAHMSSTVVWIRITAIWSDDGEIELEPVKIENLGVLLDVPTKFAQWAMKLFTNGPIEELGIAHISGKAMPQYLEYQESSTLYNDWTIYVPFLVAHAACIYSSVWLVEEERVPLFDALVKKSLIKASVEFDFEIESAGQLEER